MVQPAFDIFCRVVDNYGDAGVCWRLARQLATLDHTVRLWIDQPVVLARLLPELLPNGEAQQIDEVSILPWDLAATATPPASGVVIEAFACTLPSAYEASMASQKCLWINLEYLSAEPWVEGCHGLPSPQANGVPKYFYFPGFTPATGGLLREPDLFERQAQARLRDRRTRLEALTGLDCRDLSDETRCVLLFSYPTAPLAGLRQAFANDPRPTWLLIPSTAPEMLYSTGALQVRRIPFVPQKDFDELLWCCDLNFVRGEDSLVRALWAGAPMVWQTYAQDGNVHLEKLAAWMQYTQWPEAVEAVQRAWNAHDDTHMAQALGTALQDQPWDAWQKSSLATCKGLVKQPDLTSRLLRFCMHHCQKS